MGKKNQIGVKPLPDNLIYTCTGIAQLCHYSLSLILEMYFCRYQLVCQIPRQETEIPGPNEQTCSSEISAGAQPSGKSGTEKVCMIMLICMILNTVESLEFVVAQFSWNSQVPLILEYTSSTKQQVKFLLNTLMKKGMVCNTPYTFKNQIKHVHNS